MKVDIVKPEALGIHFLDPLPSIDAELLSLSLDREEHVDVVIVDFGSMMGINLHYKEALAPQVKAALKAKVMNPIVFPEGEQCQIMTIWEDPEDTRILLQNA